MSMFFVLPLALVATALGAAALWLIVALQRRIDALEVSVDGCQQRLRGLAAEAASQGDDLAVARKDLERLRDQLQRVASGDGANPALNQAIRMARKGLGSGEIMATCGLSQMEADLLVLVHGVTARSGEDQRASSP